LSKDSPPHNWELDITWSFCWFFQHSWTPWKLWVITPQLD
jgi:hypothetical protein